GEVGRDGLEGELDGMRLFGRARLEKLAVQGPKGPIEVSGNALARGRRISLEDGSALLGGERVALTGSYDLDGGVVQVQSSTEGAKLGPLLGALSDGVPVD